MYAIRNNNVTDSYMCTCMYAIRNTVMVVTVTVSGCTRLNRHATFVNPVVSNLHVHVLGNYTYIQVIHDTRGTKYTCVYVCMSLMYVCVYSTCMSCTCTGYTHKYGVLRVPVPVAGTR